MRRPIFFHYPVYFASEDIYSLDKEEKDFDSENASGGKIFIKQGKFNEEDFGYDLSGFDLDIPGFESDDYLENIGREDEENNYDSLGNENFGEMENLY